MQVGVCFREFSDRPRTADCGAQSGRPLSPQGAVLVTSVPPRYIWLGSCPACGSWGSSVGGAAGEAEAVTCGAGAAGAGGVGERAAGAASEADGARAAGSRSLPGELSSAPRSTLIPTSAKLTSGASAPTGPGAESVAMSSASVSALLWELPHPPRAPKAAAAIAVLKRGIICVSF